MKNKFKRTFEIETSETSVKEGFDLTGDMVEQALKVQQAMLEYAVKYAYNHEVKALQELDDCKGVGRKKR